jgi:hypothetical protein
MERSGEKSFLKLKERDVDFPKDKNLLNFAG